VPRNDPSSALTASIIQFRQYRTNILPAELFSEPAWDLLLELFLADAEGRRITAREVAEKSSISLDDMLTLSAQALQRMEQIIDRARILHSEASYSRTSE
jgi:hypothetical protein